MTHTWDLKPVYSKVDLGLGQDWDTTQDKFTQETGGLVDLVRATTKQSSKRSRGKYLVSYARNSRRS